MKTETICKFIDDSCKTVIKTLGITNRDICIAAGCVLLLCVIDDIAILSLVSIIAGIFIGRFVNQNNKRKQQCVEERIECERIPEETEENENDKSND